MSAAMADPENATAAVNANTSLFMVEFPRVGADAGGAFAADSLEVRGKARVKPSMFAADAKPANPNLNIEPPSAPCA